MRYYNLFILSLLLLLGGIGTTQAQEGGKLQEPVYVIDMQRVVAESIAGKAARNNVEEAARKKQVGLKSFEIKLQSEREKLAKQQALLSEDALEEKVAALQKKERELNRKVQDQRAELSRLSQKQLALVVEAADEVIRELGEKEGYSFILEKDPRLVVYTRDKYDLTDRVISLLDKKKIGL